MHSDGRFAGAIPSDALMTILREEHVEDLHQMAGIWISNLPIGNQLPYQFGHSPMIAPIDRRAPIIGWRSTRRCPIMISVLLSQRLNQRTACVATADFFNTIGHEPT